MAHFIWFDNDNLDYGGIGAVEYGNAVASIVCRRPVEAKRTGAGNDNPPPLFRHGEPNSLYALLEETVTLECEG
ncbi:MAG: hypothetical protein KDC18_11735 [Alphaproteobacteria bacterium]|nr:hypothetical protein [Alphaproteobacteria bacterium]MCB9929499.1 hypothetical protein [Alphaproteobacteria bacterium]